MPRSPAFCGRINIQHIKWPNSPESPQRPGYYLCAIRSAILHAPGVNSDTACTFRGYNVTIWARASGPVTGNGVLGAEQHQQQAKINTFQGSSIQVSVGSRFNGPNRPPVGCVLLHLRMCQWIRLKALLLLLPWMIL